MGCDAILLDLLSRGYVASNKLLLSGLAHVLWRMW
jgi:hypothetical protein